MGDGGRSSRLKPLPQGQALPKRPVEHLQRARELRIDRRLDHDGAAVLRMHEFQPLRVQHHPVHAAPAEDAVVDAPTVAGSAAQVVLPALQLATNSSETTCLQPPPPPPPTVTTEPSPPLVVI